MHVHLVLKAVSVIVMIAGLFLLGVEPEKFLVAVGDWMMGRGLDKLAIGGGVIALGSLIWFISMRIDPRLKD